MNLTDLSTRQWPSVAAAVALVALFGLTSIASLPIQLLPTIEEPQISVANFWRAAAPEEMEANIIEPQENVLRNTPGVTNISSFIGRGSGFVNLSFAVGTDIQTAKLDVINNLNQAPPRPGDALVLRHNGSFVFRVNDENIAEQIAVEIGDSAGDLVAVTGPLDAGDRVAIRGAENLQEGASVKIMTSQGTTGKASAEG
jgi:hypothetical protein